jgi:FkbM family methyltransferase
MLELCWRLARGSAQMMGAGRLPSRRALAAVANLSGWRLSRRWPPIRRLDAGEVAIGFGDLLALQSRRSADPVVLVVGAFDGVSNDPTSAFVQQSGCRAVFVEPQPAAFARLRERFGARPRVTLHNAAIDAGNGRRTLYRIPPGVAGLPAWTEQLASFDRAHVAKHEERAPGLTRHIVETEVPTMDFATLLDRDDVRRLDVLQIDAEGMDAQLIAWFPFERLRPALLHYETAHMTAFDRAATNARLRKFGYAVLPTESADDDMAFLF